MALLDGFHPRCENLNLILKTGRNSSSIYGWVVWGESPNLTITNAKDHGLVQQVMLRNSCSCGSTHQDTLKPKKRGFKEIKSCRACLCFVADNVVTYQHEVYMIQSSVFKKMCWFHHSLQCEERNDETTVAMMRIWMTTELGGPENNSPKSLTTLTRNGVRGPQIKSDFNCIQDDLSWGTIWTNPTDLSSSLTLTHTCTQGVKTYYALKLQEYFFPRPVTVNLKLAVT